MSHAPRIGVYAIMKNEAANAEGWAETVQNADHVTVLDTGSTDNTPRILGRCLEQVGVRRYQILDGRIAPWRFDVAHNTALSLVPGDIDICVPLAADERMNADWYDCLVDAVPPNSHLRVKPAHRAYEMAPHKFSYIYEFAPGMSFRHDRIHSRDGYVWRYPFHEGVYPCAPEAEVRVHVPRLRIKQTQDGAVDRAKRDLVLAEMALREFPNEPRMIFYAGRQYLYAGQPERALQILERYGPMARGQKLDHPVEAQWCADAIAKCWAMIAKKRGLA